MLRTANHVMRIVLAVMLFQFFAPVFLPITTLRVSDEVHYQVDQNSIYAPELLKETDETEFEASSKSKNVAVLNLTMHHLSITASHNKKSYFSSYPQDEGPSSQLFTIYGTFRI